jgi:hypothetical protein
LIDEEGETDAAGGVEGRGVGDVDGETSSASPTSQAWVEGDGEGAAASANPAEEGVEGDAAGDWGARRRSSAFEEESFPAQGMVFAFAIPVLLYFESLCVGVRMP